MTGHAADACWRRHFRLACAATGLAGLAGFAGVSGAPAAERYVIDSSHTFPMFEVSHLGFSLHRGRFNRTTGVLELDLAAGRGKVDIEIDADSLDTGDEALERELRSANFFAVDSHPQLRFASDRFVFAGGRLTAVHGALTLRGVSRAVTLDVDHFRCGQNPAVKKFVCGANARTTIRRSEFGMARFVPFVGDEVVITIQVEATRE